MFNYARINTLPLKIALAKLNVNLWEELEDGQIGLLRCIFIKSNLVVLDNLTIEVAIEIEYIIRSIFDQFKDECV